MGSGAYFTSSGLSRDGVGTFDVPATAARAYSTTHSLFAAANLFEKIIQPSLIQAIKEVREGNPRYLENHGVLEVAFCGIENGVPVACIRWFSKDVDPNNPGCLEVKRLDLPRQGLVVLGVDKGIDSFMKDRPRPTNLADQLFLVNQLIELEVEESPDEVGEPIRIIRIDRNGEQIIQ